MNLARVRGTVVATRRSDTVDGAAWLLAGTAAGPSGAVLAANEPLSAEAVKETGLVEDVEPSAFSDEHGFRHTAMIHSHDIEKLSRMARVMNCSLFVKNGPCTAGFGQGGAGHTSFAIASPTGEGITRARTFTRERRRTLVDAFRII